MSIPACRFCGAALNQVMIDLGDQPLANSYLARKDLERAEPRYPLRVRVCHACYLVQTDETVRPETVFSDYAYFSSYSKAWLEHARRYCQAMTERLALGPHSFVIEVASNDGYLLKNFVAGGIRCLGIEPAENVAAVARQAGVPTQSHFLGLETARAIREQHGPADLLAANNVLAHVPDINDFVAGLATLLARDGVLTVEFPHLVNLVAHNQFDTIYHEHYSYLSLAAAERIFARHGLFVFDVEQLATHGGSLRLFAAPSRSRGESDALKAIRILEKAAGVETPDYYAGFTRRAEAAIAALRDFLDKARADGKQVAGYGAAAKGNTLLNAARVGTQDMAYVVDANPHKQGHYLPGSHLPIFAPEHIAQTRPDYILILPWNLQGEIMSQLGFTAAWNARFLKAIPQLEFIAP
jgi:hypothetical protein